MIHYRVTQGGGRTIIKRSSRRGRRSPAHTISNLRRSIRGARLVLLLLEDRGHHQAQEGWMEMAVVKALRDARRVERVTEGR